MSRRLTPSSERIYRAIKQQVLNGGFRPGERIDAVGLAEAMASSLTPVRAALQRLVGERLVEARPSEGFHRPPVTEVGLKALYDWNGRVVLLAAQLAASEPEPARPADSPGGAEFAPTEAARLFSGLARRTGNAACAETIAGLNDQLHAVRRLEADVLGDVDTELQALAVVLEGGALAAQRQAIIAYHRRRIGAAPALVNRLYRPPA
jgi:DNA-binding FadR family transcriptional regulator